MMDRQTLEIIEREATRTAWIGMALFFVFGAATIAGIGIAVFGMLMFILVWVGCGVIAIQARHRLKS